MSNLPISEAGHAILSPKAMAILREVGDSAYRKLVVDAGNSTPQCATALQAMTPDQLFIEPVKHPDDAAAALAGMWLWIDDLGRLPQDRSGLGYIHRQLLARNHAPPRGRLFKR